MLIFLYGPDDYRRIQKKRGLIAEFLKKRSEIGLRTFDLAARDWFDGFDEFSRSEPLFEPAKLAVFENAFEIDAPKLAKILKPLAGTRSLTVLLSERDKPVKALGFLLEKPAIPQKFENLTGAELVGFIGAEAKQLGLRIAMPAAQFLAQVYAGNSWALATELEKLATLKAAANPAIERKDLDMPDLEAAPNYWALLSGLKSPDVRTRLSTLEKLFAMGDAPAKIFNILAAQAGQKIPQFAEFDFMVKSGKLDYEEVLVDLAIS
ncbi:MAG TPA: hypothetical protein VMT81_02745 [Candidatus Paceibacterota bacterium]|nr:hypothetical protein [Candidatus Paceibacterota bacterium]